MVYKKSMAALLDPPSATQLDIILKDTNQISDDKLKHNEYLIQEWISCQNHFPKGIDKAFIRGMLRGNKHILERTKQKLENYLSAKHMYPDMYTNRSPFAKDIVQAMDATNMAAMSKLTPKGYRIFIFRVNRIDPSEFNFQSAVKLFLMMYDLILTSDVPSAGDIAIFDASNLTAGHLTKVFGPFLKTMVTILKEAYAIRLKELHFINAPAMLTKMMSAIKPILHSKVGNSIHIHDNQSKIVEAIGAEYLPLNYGGNLKNLSEIVNDWYQVMNENSAWFEAQERIKITTGIPKQIHNKFQSQNTLGIEGSFRKLEID